jgi:toxin secretion/phage lysis holin
MNLFTYLCAMLGVLGSMLTTLLGGFDAWIQIFLILLLTDYISGVVVATVFKTSTKTVSGAYSSKAFVQGATKKFFMLVLVMIANQFDLVLGLDVVRNAVLITFCLNELASVFENAGLMGIKIPKALTNMLDVLKQKGDSGI